MDWPGKKAASHFEGMVCTLRHYNTCWQYLRVYRSAFLAWGYMPKFVLQKLKSTNAPQSQMHSLCGFAPASCTTLHCTHRMLKFKRCTFTCCKTATAAHLYCLLAQIDSTWVKLSELECVLPSWLQNSGKSSYVPWTHWSCISFGSRGQVVSLTESWVQVTRAVCDVWCLHKFIKRTENIDEVHIICFQQHLHTARLLWLRTFSEKSSTKAIELCSALGLRKRIIWNLIAFRAISRSCLTSQTH